LQLKYPDVKVLDLPPPVRKSSHTTMPPMATDTIILLEWHMYFLPIRRGIALHPLLNSCLVS
jgi:hypothetical protein